MNFHNHNTPELISLFGGPFGTLRKQSTLQTNIKCIAEITVISISSAVRLKASDYITQYTDFDTYLRRSEWENLNKKIQYIPEVLR